MGIPCPGRWAWIGASLRWWAEQWDHRGREKRWEEACDRGKHKNEEISDVWNPHSPNSDSLWLVAVVGVGEEERPVPWETMKCENETRGAVWETQILIITAIRLGWQTESQRREEKLKIEGSNEPLVLLLFLLLWRRGMAATFGSGRSSCDCANGISAIPSMGMPPTLTNG